MQKLSLLHGSSPVLSSYKHKQTCLKNEGKQQGLGENFVSKGPWEWFFIITA
jgi:hypothetical protein